MDDQQQLIEIFAHPPEYKIVGVAGKGAYAVVIKARFDLANLMQVPVTPGSGESWQMHPTTSSTLDPDAVPSDGTETPPRKSGALALSYLSNPGPTGPTEVAIKRLVDFASVNRVATDVFKLHYLRKVCRELEILAHFSHVDQIVNITECYLSMDELDVFFVMPFIPYDLEEMIKSRSLEEDLIRWLIFQILLALEAVHSAGVMHRDLTLKNVLVDGETWDCRLADFGLSRARETSTQDITLDVVTLEYRAPELLMQYKWYDGKVDIWSLGCIMAELFLRYRFFRPQKRDVFFQLRCIMETVTGFPDLNDAREAASDTAIAFLERTQAQSTGNLPAPVDLRKYFGAAPSAPTVADGQSSPDTGASAAQGFPAAPSTISEDALDVLKAALVWNPHRRASATSLLAMPWFTKDQYCRQVMEQVAKQRAETPISKFTEFVERMDGDELRNRILERAGNRRGTLETTLAALPPAARPLNQ